VAIGGCDRGDAAGPRIAVIDEAKKAERRRAQLGKGRKSLRGRKKKAGARNRGIGVVFWVQAHRRRATHKRSREKAKKKGPIQKIWMTSRGWQKKKGEREGRGLTEGVG